VHGSSGVGRSSEWEGTGEGAPGSANGFVCGRDDSGRVAKVAIGERRRGRGIHRRAPLARPARMRPPRRALLRARRRRRRRRPGNRRCRRAPLSLAALFYPSSPRPVEIPLYLSFPRPTRESQRTHSRGSPINRESTLFSFFHPPKKCSPRAAPPSRPRPPAPRPPCACARSSCAPPSSSSSRRPSSRRPRRSARRCWPTWCSRPLPSPRRASCSTSTRRSRWYVSCQRDTWA
jgi:hypothetical protein